MTNLNQINKCSVCGNIVEMVHTGAGKLVCCGQPMELQVPNTQEASVEKHVPVTETLANGIKVSVGSVLHPMLEEHHIEWVEVIDGDKVERIYLKPGGEPIAEFCLTGENLQVRAYCNIHGLWQKS